MGAVEWVTEEENYDCPLSEETQKIAKDELREDKNTRDQALDQIKNWIKLNPRIENCRLGESSSSLIIYVLALINYIYIIINTLFQFDCFFAQI